ncbi:PREDICTED: coiled-coil domain-containing protein 62 [Merops nubicus]|uniref:coiled-coil domain-containing protein 62 n=1 Tax=Merops nubicus TaxID=57421 RepID=UPI0004F001CD|nr:PREDICTED: coiled-coil domain-containing protein 62 [Merops nubicus]
MVAAHQTQLLAWEGDQQKILTLAERCSLLENELNKRNEFIKSLKQQKFKEMSQKVADASLHCQALEEKNQSLHHSVLDLSAKTGQLQAREQKLLTMLKLKDEAILETTDHITEFTSKFRNLGIALRAAKATEIYLNKEKQDLKLRLKELTLERNKLQDDLSEKMKENNKQHKDIVHLKEENISLRKELALTVELLQFAKSKQARTDTELSSLRQIYLKQQRELQFLHVSSEGSWELRQKHEKVAHERSIRVTILYPESNSKTDTVKTEGTHGKWEECGTARVPKSRVKTTSEMCEVDNRLLQSAPDLEETTSVHLNQKVVKVSSLLTEEEKQDVASSSDELHSEVFCEANNTRPLRNREISEDGVESREPGSLESSSPECEHCLNASSCIASPSTSTQSTITSDETSNENKTWEERTEIPLCQKSRDTPAAIHEAEPDSCSKNFTIKNDSWWKPVSDLEWLKIFRFIKGDGEDSSCLRTAQEMKCASSERLCACYV